MMAFFGLKLGDANASVSYFRDSAQHPVYVGYSYGNFGSNLSSRFKILSLDFGAGFTSFSNPLLKPTSATRFNADIIFTLYDGEAMSVGIYGGPMIVDWSGVWPHAGTQISLNFASWFGFDVAIDSWATKSQYSMSPSALLRFQLSSVFFRFGITHEIYKRLKSRTSPDLKSEISPIMSLGVLL